MSIAASITLIAVGAILRYAVTFQVSGVDREAVGLILMIAGFAGLALSLLFELIHSDSEKKPPSGYDDQTRRLR
jgi:hypothetical protein